MKQTSAVFTKATKLPLSTIQRELGLINLNLSKPRWTVRLGDSGTSTTELEGNYTLQTFAKTWEFLNTAAMHAQKARHHPTITTTYNRVKFIITTHDEENQVTEKDIKLARAIEISFNQNFATRGPVKNQIQLESSWKEASQIINDLTKKP